jgi:hypothetical protein
VFISPAVLYRSHMFISLPAQYICRMCVTSCPVRLPDVYISFLMEYSCQMFISLFAQYICQMFAPPPVQYICQMFISLPVQYTCQMFVSLPVQYSCQMFISLKYVTGIIFELNDRTCVLKVKRIREYCWIIHLFIVKIPSPNLICRHRVL